MRILTVVWRDETDTTTFGVPDDWIIPYGKPDPMLWVPPTDQHGGIYIALDAVKWCSVHNELPKP